MHEGGGVYHSYYNRMVAATAIVRMNHSDILAENRGTIPITSNWAKSLLYRPKFVEKRKLNMKKTVKNY